MILHPKVPPDPPPVILQDRQDHHNDQCTDKTTNSENSPHGSNKDPHETVKHKPDVNTNSSLPNDGLIATLLPYLVNESIPNKSRSNNPRPTKPKPKKKADPALFEELFGPSCWPRFFNIKLKQNDDFILDEILLNDGHEVTMNKQYNGLRLVEVHSEHASKTLRNWTENPPEDIEISEHQSLNYKFGTIVIPNDIECEGIDFLHWGPKILKNLKLHKVPAVNVATFYARNRRRGGPDLRIAKIAFESHDLPLEIPLAGRRLEVRPYVSRPRQCTKCWRFGHPAKYCNNETQFCLKCSFPNHDHLNCSNTFIRCVNCGEKHKANARSCQHYEFNNKVYQFQQERGFPRKAAIGHLKRTRQISRISYASHLKGSDESSETETVPLIDLNSNYENQKQSEKSVSTPAVETGNRFLDLEDECIDLPDLMQFTTEESQQPKSKRNLPVSPESRSNASKKKSKIPAKTHNVIKPVTEMDEVKDKDSNPNQSRMNFEVPASQVQIDLQSTPVSKHPTTMKTNEIPSKLPRHSAVQKYQNKNASVRSKICTDQSRIPKCTTKSTNKETSKSVNSLKSSLPQNLEGSSIVNMIHTSFCGCPECFMEECRKIPRKDTTSYKNCVESFINSRICPLKHPHKEDNLCSKLMKSNKDTTENNLKTLIASMLSSSENTSSIQQIPIVEGASGSSLPNYTRIKDNANSAINLQNLTSLTN